MARPKNTDNPNIDAILSVATSMFADRGYYGTSMREIAKAAGCNMATISYHFGNKKGLYQAVYKNLAKKEWDLYYQYLEELSEEKFHSQQEFRRFYIDLLDLYIDYSVNSPITFRLWRQYVLDFPQETGVIASEYDQPIYKLIIEYFEKAVTNGIVSPKTENLKMIVGTLTSVTCRFCEKQFNDSLSGEDFIGVEKVEDLKDFLILYLDLMFGIHSES